jgi:hypothetical protein
MMSNIKINGKWITNPEYERKYRRLHLLERNANSRKVWVSNPKIREYYRLNQWARKHTVLSSRCELCDSTEHLERHHPDIWNYPEIIVTLCVECHNSFRKEQCAQKREEVKKKRREIEWKAGYERVQATRKLLNPNNPHQPTVREIAPAVGLSRSWVSKHDVYGYASCRDKERNKP